MRRTDVSHPSGVLRRSESRPRYFPVESLAWHPAHFAIVSESRISKPVVVSRPPCADAVESAARKPAPTSRRCMPTYAAVRSTLSSKFFSVATLDVTNRRANGSHGLKLFGELGVRHLTGN